MRSMRISPSMVVALLALTVAVGTGGALAASRYLITSPSQLSPGVRNALKGKTGPEGKEGLSFIIGEAGNPGGPGPIGATGPRGVTGPEGKAPPPTHPIYPPETNTNTETIAASTTGSVTALCEQHYRVIAGGETVGAARLVSAEPEGRGWKVVAENTTKAPVTIKAWVACLQEQALVAGGGELLP